MAPGRPLWAPVRIGGDRQAQAAPQRVARGVDLACGRFGPALLFALARLARRWRWVVMVAEFAISFTN